MKGLASFFNTLAPHLKIGRLLNLLGVQTTGYRPRVLTTDLSLGLINGVDYVLWGYTFASILFTGALAGYLPWPLLQSFLFTSPESKSRQSPSSRP